MTDALTLLFSQDFLIRALFVGVLISLCCALLGVSLVLKRFSMIGDGLSHVGFGALAIGAAAGVAPLYFALPIVIIAAFLLLRMNESGKIKGDTATALISTGALAVGVMATSMTSGMNIDIYNYMFGSILTMTSSDVALSSVLAVAVIVISIVFYHEIFASCFDESFAKATGTKTSVYNMLIAALTAITVVIGMRMMGALLISSLIIFPTVISMRVSKSYKSTVITSVLVSVLCFVAGLVASIRFEAPTGASVVCVNIVVLALFTFFGKLMNTNNNKLSYKLKKVIAVAVSLLLAFSFFAVVLSKDIAVYEKDKPSVVATTFAPYDFSRQIAKDKADITMLLSPGEESHTFEPTSSDIQKIKQADIFIYGGGESDKWVDTILDASDMSSCKVIKMMDLTSNLKEETAITANDHAEEDHSHNHSNDEEEYDEHVWTSISNAKVIAEGISNALCEKDKENEKIYKENLSQYLTELSDLSLKFQNLSKKAQGKTFIIADRFPLLYLFNEFNLDYCAAYPGCSAQTEVNPVTVSILLDKIKLNGIKTVYKVDMSRGNVAYALSESAKVKVETLYSCHSLTAEDFENGETYISLMTKNYERLYAEVS